MEKQIKKQHIVNLVSHKFYCDRCGKLIGEVNECLEDGWYPILGEYKRKYRASKGWLELNKNYCDSCAEMIDYQIELTLKEFGFKDN